MMRYEQLILSKDDFIFLVFIRHFCDKYREHGSRFGEHFGSSRNHPESIGICPGTLISHFGII